LANEKTEILDFKRKDMEKGLNCLYRSVTLDIFTDHLDYVMSNDFFDKDATVCIFNDLDNRSI